MIVELEGIATIASMPPSKAKVRETADLLGCSEQAAYVYLRGISGGLGFIDTLELAVLDHVMGNAAYTQVTQWFMGLSSSTPTDAGGNFTEQSIGTGGYARVECEGTGSNGPAWDAATGTAPAYVANTEAITFPAATADWFSAANATHFGLFTASTGGTAQIVGNLTTAKPILNGDTASFAAGAIRVQLGDPGDTYT